MLYHFLPGFSDVHIIFNVFVFITFRAAGALVTALVVSLVLGPRMIRWLTRVRVGQVVRQGGPQTHLEKAGTPTMGGILIVASATLSTLLWARLDNAYILITIVSLLWMGALGFLDDYLKVVRRHPQGLIARYKMVGQWTFALGLGLFLVLNPISDIETNRTMLPFFSDYSLLVVAWAYVPFVGVVVSGTSNAVNLTDGLDGLATGLVAIAAGTFAIFAYVLGRVDTSDYLGLFYLPGAGELTIFALALSGACLGFLWYNCHPAEVFMGDTGSLAIGGAIGVMAILLKSEFLLVIVGGVFVMETVSVMVQVGWFRHTTRKYGEGRRVFRMAPIHHHFEQLGWPETKVVVRFWLLGILCAMVALSALKIR